MILQPTNHTTDEHEQSGSLGIFNEIVIFTVLGIIAEIRLGINKVSFVYNEIYTVIYTERDTKFVIFPL